MLAMPLLLMPAFDIQIAFPALLAMPCHAALFNRAPTAIACERAVRMGGCVLAEGNGDLLKCVGTLLGLRAG